MDNPEKIELRRRHPHPILAFVLTAVLIGVAGQAEPPSRELLIVYSGNALGELKPCGCDKEEDQGGIERRMGYLKRRQASKTQTLLVDLGDNFKKPTRQGKLKAQTMMKALAQMQYDAITPGDKDLVYGNGFLASGGPLPWVSANLRLDGFSMPASKTQVLDNGLKVFITAVADPDLFYTSPDSNIRLSDPREAFRRQLKRARESEPPDLVVVLTHMPRDKGVRFLDVPGVDVVINGHIEKDSDKIDMNPVIKDGKIFVQPGPLGQKMGELFVRIDGKGRKTFRQKMVRLGSQAPMDPEMTRLYDEYNAQVEEIFLDTLAAKRKKKESRVYAGDQTCAPCHAEAHNIWSQSKHSGAYQALQEVNKSFDPECLACHTVGFGQPGGFISEIDTPNLKNVQCEVCHGPRWEHSRNPEGGFAQEARKACGRCHVKKHSPKFDFSRYWPRIRH